MSLKFVSFYGVVVLMTSLFFQFVPLPNMLSWQEILLSKLLNQSPALLCLGYLWVQRNRIKEAVIFYLLTTFLLLNVFSEVYYYFVSKDYLLMINICHNSFIYLILAMLFKKQSLQVRGQIVNPKNISYAVLAGLFFIVGFSFSLLKVYQEHYATNKLFFFVLLIAMVMTTTTVCVSFFVDKPFSRNWYKLVVGTIAIAVLDVYLYLSLFVFDAYSNLIYTIGKLIFSIGILLIVERSMRKCLNKVPMTVVYKKVPNAG